MSRHSIYITLLSSLVGGSALAEPSQPRKPLVAMNSTKVQLTGFGRTARVVRTRTPGKTTARFDAEAKAIPDNAVLLFEAHSVAKSGYTLRWRCVAATDVRDCFTTPLQLRYLPQDARIVLTVTPVSTATSQGLALLASSGGLEDERISHQDHTPAPRRWKLERLHHSKHAAFDHRVTH